MCALAAPGLLAALLLAACANPPAGQPASPTAPADGATTGAAGSGPAITHTLEGRAGCTVCHKVGGAGAGAPGGLGMPADHQGRADARCLECHKAAS
jgi:hypothetical protein